MRCPECGCNNFNDTENCKRCGYSNKSNSREPAVNTQSPFGDYERDSAGEIEWDKGFNQLFDSSCNKEHTGRGLSNFGAAVEAQGEDSGYTSLYKKIKTAGSAVGSEMHPGLATTYERFAAFLIDLSLLLITSFLTIYIGFYFLGINLIEDFSELVHLILPAYLIINILLSTYMVICNGVFGKTPGKAIMGLSIVTDTGDDLTYGVAFTRWVGYYLSALPLMVGFFWILIDEDYQCWHDKLAGTLVVKD